MSPGCRVYCVGVLWASFPADQLHHDGRLYALHLLGEVSNHRLTHANPMCSLDNAVSLDGAKLLVSYLEEYAKSA